MHKFKMIGHMQLKAINAMLRKSELINFKKIKGDR